MMGIATEKISGGKLLRIKTLYTIHKIVDVKITGDFFMHPEEGVFALEKRVIGIPTNTEKEEITRILDGAVQERSMELVGISTEDIARVLKKSLNLENMVTD